MQVQIGKIGGLSLLLKLCILIRFLFCLVHVSQNTGRAQNTSDKLFLNLDVFLVHISTFAPPQLSDIIFTCSMSEYNIEECSYSILC